MTTSTAAGTTKRIDLNSDVGESFGHWSLGDDAAVLRSATSANVACGFHAGDPSGILATCRTAVQASAVVGAHPGYRDLAGFGRRFLDVLPTELTADLVYQIGAVQALARAAGTEVRYVKPHGALYNTIVHHEAQAQAVVEAILAVDPGLPLVVLPNSAVERLGRSAGLRTVREAFADRAYRADGTLVPRSEPGAVLHEARAVEQGLRIARDGVVEAVDGSLVPVEAESICIHGDSPDAVAMAAALRRALEAAGITVRSFVSP
ncbi:LamB/YcsF family protein [Psychromicrobium xiongbiense]|uniref:LamB/YcsF family protein n=1 Tax=Psychromicrobium xiongbiense TaxID=3051184 RepID=UPI0025536975|nr:5-oxoprolinase subunit PxpA [Psychromicrobium sp. YIM S02556]